VTRHGARRLRLLRLLLEDGREAGTARLCAVCATATGVTGAGITLMPEGVLGGPVCASDAVALRLERLQFDLTEGPCVDAYRLDVPVLEPDLRSVSTGRWLAFRVAAAEAGARAVFGFPMHIGAVRLGSVNLYRDRPGPPPTRSTRTPWSWPPSPRS
jgi:hypothetical protein